MEKNFKYFLDDSTGILYKHYYGPITIEDINSSWNYAIVNSLIPKNTKGFLLDYRKARLNIKLGDYTRIAEYYSQHLEIFRDKKIAILTQSIEDIAIPSLVETLDNQYFSRPFYTIEAALQWILF
ncbi:MAG: hypothetical protein K8H86_03785 [Ignavibacteriaceae bacterium]|nr:hypothetical protein [Ignavibacteriaceae bacterium]